MKSVFRILTVIFALFGSMILAEDKTVPEPALGKLFVQDAAGKWSRLMSAPNDYLYLYCADAQGRFQPCAIDKVEFAPQNPDTAPDFPKFGKLSLRPKGADVSR